MRRRCRQQTAWTLWIWTGEALCSCLYVVCTVRRFRDECSVMSDFETQLALLADQFIISLLNMQSCKILNGATGVIIGQFWKKATRSIMPWFVLSFSFLIRHPLSIICNRLERWRTTSSQHISTCRFTWCLAPWWKRSFGELWTAWTKMSAFRWGNLGASLCKSWLFLFNFFTW